ncbi:unnamed protein product [Rhodiola kirilowii]
MSLTHLPQTPSRSLLFNTSTKSFNFKPTSSFSVRASSSDSVVTLLDYGAGNVRSVRNAIRHLGFDIKDVQTPQDILEADRLVFPGVGAFAAAMDVLSHNGMAEALCRYIEQDRPFLGICLGMQLLFDSSEENGPVKGLGLIPGEVGRFDSSNGFRVPHIGWNALQIRKDSDLLEVVEDRHVYFVHSYRAMPSSDNQDWVSSTCNYGDTFIASIEKGNVHAVQFHPEKSGEVGHSILKKFLYPKSSYTKGLAKGNAKKLAKRVIACLDVRANDQGDLVVTKGDQYDVRENTDENEVRNLGKPVQLAQQYYKDGADEVSFLNITGFRDFPLGDLPMLQVLRITSENVFVPLTVGGGIRDFTDGNGRHYSSLEVASEYFRSGADKISIGSDAVYAAEEFIKTGVKTGKSSLEQISRIYGNQAVVVSIDPRRVYIKDPSDVKFKAVKLTNRGPNGEEFAWYQCTVNGGREGKNIGAFELAKAVEELGAGEILLNCIDCDGQGKGFDIDLIKLVSDAVSIPVIASSGAGAVYHFSEVFQKTNASAALAAGIFHRKEVPVKSVKEHLLKEGIEKSEIMLSKNATQELIDHIRQIMGVKVVQSHAKYLGLPTVVSRSYSLTMQGILDKIQNKTESWKSVMLSQGDKVVNQIHFMINNFWWCHSVKSKGVHWIKGEVLRQSKDEGGLGFYNFKYLNIAFLAKQCWRMVKALESLAGKVFKAKYFPNCHLLDAPLSAKPSHVWRALHQAIPVIRHGCCLEAETGGVRWKMNSSGILDIKSAYKSLRVMNDLNNQSRGEQSDKRKKTKMWKFIWRLPIPRKIRIFLWRLYHAAIPTGTQMMRRHLAHAFSCPVCQYKFEDDMHAFISCWWSKAMWSYMGYGIHVDCKCFQIMADVIFYVFANYKPEEFCQISIALWFIWYNRNRVAHNNQSMSPISAVMRIKKLYKDFTMNKKGMISSINCFGLSWQRPKRPYIKANCDGSWNELDKT